MTSNYASSVIPPYFANCFVFNASFLFVLNISVLSYSASCCGQLDFMLFVYTIIYNAQDFIVWQCLVVHALISHLNRLETS